MALDSATLVHLARLARLSLGASELELLGADLDRTLAMIDQLQQIDVNGLEPLAQPQAPDTGNRVDSVTEEDHSAQLLGLSPAAEGGYFLVPKVIE
jgi:aspartyl-tRNA(Asn)/glutamyl-tRNA(Gln) amidotransferase subunit C